MHEGTYGLGRLRINDELLLFQVLEGRKEVSTKRQMEYGAAYLEGELHFCRRKRTVAG